MGRGAIKSKVLYVICYQLKIDCYEMFYVKSQNNHKENNCRRFRKENEKRIKACRYKKINKAHRKVAAEENQDKNAAGQTGSN